VVTWKVFKNRELIKSTRRDKEELNGFNDKARSQD
jgi:hypothetical protein